MDTVTNTFKYTPLLQPDSIRLLVLKPGSPGSAIHCSLIHITLSACHYDIYRPYTALSYVWGNAKDTRTIFLHKQSFQITANLAAALNSLRDKKISIRIWADAICIDQANVLERNQQVGLMRDIYSFAQNTIIYLGELEIEDQKLVEFLRSYRELDEEPRDLEQIRKLADEQILSRPWFSRVWIFQELVLSKDVWVQLGQERVPWDNFCLAILGSYGHQEEAYLRDNSPDSSSDASMIESSDEDELLDRGTVVRQGSPIIDHSNFEMLSSMREARQKFLSSRISDKEEPVSLFTVMSARRGSGVTDLRDMVYGHLAVAGLHHGTRYKKDPNTIPPPLVDYNKSAVEVFAEATAYISRSGLGLKILCYVDSSSNTPRLPGLPSWVPGWSMRPGQMVPIQPTLWSHYSNGSLPPSESLRRESFLKYCCLKRSSILAFQGTPMATIESPSKIISSSLTGELDEAVKASRAAATDKRRWESICRQAAIYSKAYELFQELIGQGTLPDRRNNHPGSLHDLFMRYVFKIDNPSILNDRRMAIPFKYSGLFQGAVVPAASRPGDQIYVLHLEFEIHLIVIRPCHGDELEAQDKESLGRQFGYSGEVKMDSFLFIGMAWMDRESLELRRRIFQHLALHSSSIVLLH